MSKRTLHAPLEDKASKRVMATTEEDEESDEFEFEPKVMIGRKREMSSIRSFLKQCLAPPVTGGALYVCGVSGTGKSEAVRQIYDGLEQKLSNKRHKMCWLTGTSTGFRASLASALGMKLKTMAQDFTASNSKLLYIVVVDEMDLLPPSDFQQLFAWASAPQSCLVLVGIANTVNIQLVLKKPYTAGRVTNEVAFFPYEASQLLEICRAKLDSDVLERFKPEALDMCARKAALRSGDLRHVMSICSQVFRFAEENSIQRIGLADVNRALWTCGSAPQIEALNTQTKFALVALANASSRSDSNDEEDDARFVAVDMATVRTHWDKLGEAWQIPIEGKVDQYVDFLVELGLVQRIATQQSNKRAPSSTVLYQVQVAREDILQGLLGKGFEQSTKEEQERALHRPIVLAFKRIRRRLLANLHQVV